MHILIFKSMYTHPYIGWTLAQTYNCKYSQSVLQLNKTH